VLKSALNNVKPILEVKSRRVGGATYQVPVEVRQDRRNALALRWLISYSRMRPDHTMASGSPRSSSPPPRTKARREEREDTHKMAEANKAFAHYRW